MAGASRGRTLVNLTNGTPDQARRTEAWATGHGAAYLDGGIMAIPSTVATSEAFILYSGQKQHFEAHEESLEVLGAAKHLGVDVGTAALYDLALLSAMDHMFNGFFHSVAMATSHKEGTAAGLTELLVPWLTDMARIMPPFAADVDAEREPDTEPSYAQGLDVVPAGARNMAQASRDAGVRAAHFARSAAALERQRAEGLTTYTAARAVRDLRTASDRPGPAGSPGLQVRPGPAWSCLILPDPDNWP